MRLDLTTWRQSCARALVVAAALGPGIFPVRGDCELTKFAAADAIPMGKFGGSLSISEIRLLVGTGDRGLGSESAYVFRREDAGTPLNLTDDVWLEEARLTPSDGIFYDRFSEWVSLDGDRAVVGSRHHDSAGHDAGAVYVFHREANDTPSDSSDDYWVEEVKLTASDAEPDDIFGWIVAIRGSWLAVGAPLDDHACPTNPDCNSGSVYLFKLNDNGTPGELSDDSWQEFAKLVGADTAEDDRFGTSVAFASDYLVVGAFFDDDACPTNPDCNSGAVYIFRLDDNQTPGDESDDVWVPEAKVTASDGSEQDRFGFSVSAYEDTLVIGAHLDEPTSCLDDVPPCVQAGTAYVFRRDDNDTPLNSSDDFWVQQAKLQASDAGPYHFFGHAVSIFDDVAVVGAEESDSACTFDPNFCNSGSAYVFRRNDNGTPTEPQDDMWIEEAKLTASDAQAGERFGFSVAVDDQWIFVGAVAGQDAGLYRPGSIYVFGGGPDCDGNRNPDVCDLLIEGSDCDGNYVFDPCDILAGAPDCDGNQVPDVCDFLAVGSDCDGNHNLDACDILTGAADCDENQILDVCDIQLGGALDGDGDGILDRCEPVVPAATTWGLLVLFLLGCTFGTLIFSTHRGIKARRNDFHP